LRIRAATLSWLAKNERSSLRALSGCRRGSLVVAPGRTNPRNRRDPVGYRRRLTTRVSTRVDPAMDKSAGKRLWLRPCLRPECPAVGAYRPRCETRRARTPTRAIFTKCASRPGSGGLASNHEDLSGLRARERRQGQVLRGVRRSARRRAGRARAARDGHRAVLRRDRLDRAWRVDRSGGPPRRAGPLLRADEGHRRVARGDGGEVHRRRGHGCLRRPPGARGRRPAGRPGRLRDARGPARARLAGADRPQHRRGRHRHRGAPGDWRCRQRGGALGAGGEVWRRPARRNDLDARPRSGRGRSARAARAEGKGRTGARLPARLGPRGAPSAAARPPSSAESGSSSRYGKPGSMSATRDAASS
jgi:hypothetical protein